MKLGNAGQYNYMPDNIIICPKTRSVGACFIKVDGGRERPLVCSLSFRSVFNTTVYIVPYWPPQENKETIK